MKALPIVNIDGQRFYVDERLMEIRNVNNPTDSAKIEDGMIELWQKWGWIEYTHLANNG